MAGFLILSAVLLFAAASVLAPAWAVRKGQKIFAVVVTLACTLPVILVLYAVWFHQRMTECVAKGEGTTIPDICESVSDIAVYLSGYLGTFLLGGVLISSLIALQRARRARLVETMSSAAH